LEKRILKLETCTDKQKKQIFIENISKKDELNFDDFFRYMKDKTDTIENINWIETKKVNRCRQQRLSINIVTPKFTNTVTPH